MYYQPSSLEVEGSSLFHFKSIAEEQSGKRFARYADLHAWSVETRELFWPLVWDFCGVVGNPGSVVLQPGKRMVDEVWFPEGQVSFRKSILNRRDDAIALVEYQEDRRVREYSYAQLSDYVDTLAASLASYGVAPGDRVALVLQNGIDAIAFSLASASIGGVVCTVAPEFGLGALRDRLLQVAPKIIVATSGYRYAGRPYSLEQKLNELLPSLKSTSCCVVVGESIALRSTDCEVVSLDRFLQHATSPIGDSSFPFNHPLYILFSSGTTGKPKCITHGVGGTLLQHRKEHRLMLNINQHDTMLYLTTTGWMMWNWTLSSLAEGITLVCYDGSPFYPSDQHIFQLLGREQVTCFGTSAKFIGESLKRIPSYDGEWFESVRQVFSTGSPLLVEHYRGICDRWQKSMPVISLSGGTDIISCFILGNPLEPLYEGEIQSPGLGMAVEVWDDTATPVVEEKGELVCTKSFPSMPIYFWGDDDDKSRYLSAYFSNGPSVWYHGDYCVQTAQGGYRMHGRSDAVLNPGGVRIGTAEIYQALEGMGEIVESVCVGKEIDDDIAVVLFVVLDKAHSLTGDLTARIKKNIKEQTSPRHVPAFIVAAPDVPKTLSGKIAEIAVREAIHLRPIANQDALSNPASLLFYQQYGNIQP